MRELLGEGCVKVLVAATAEAVATDARCIGSSRRKRGCEVMWTAKWEVTGGGRLKCSCGAAACTSVIGKWTDDVLGCSAIDDGHRVVCADDRRPWQSRMVGIRAIDLV